MLTVDVEDRIRRCKMAVYGVLLNTRILSEVIKSELITCIAIWNCGASIIYTNCDTYKLNFAYRKMYRYIFKMSLHASISDLLNVFNIIPVVELIENKTRTFMRQLESKYIKLRFLSIYVKMVYKPFHLSRRRKKYAIM